jgi:hypothetical protein
MADPEKRSAREFKPREPKIELLPVLESEAEFKKRKEEVQVLLVQMFLRSKQRGRPRKNEEDESYAA